MSLPGDELAVELLCWRSRARQGLTRIRPGDRAEARFVDHLAARRPHLHSDDLATVARAFLTATPDYAGWHDALVEPVKRSFRIEGGSPKIQAGGLSTWRRLTSRIDPDALTAFLWARSGRPSPTYDQAYSKGWGFYLAASDPALERVLARGVCDTHVHLEACDPIPLLWLRLATGRVEVGALKLFSGRVLASLAEDVPALERRMRDRDDLDAARVHRDALIRLLGLGSDGGDDFDLLRGERLMLVSASRRLLAMDGDVETLARAYDAYAYRKNLFLRRHVQGAGQGVGLSRFRDFLDRGETLVENRAKKARPAVRQARFARMMALACEPAALRSVELRIAPHNDLKGWIGFVKLWRARFASRVDAPRVDFVVHFIRDASPREDPTCRMRFGALRKRLDRQSAVLHLFRTRHPDLASTIVGIDVANLERGCPPEIFAPYLALLRGDSGLAGSFGNPALTKWRSLSERGQHLEPIDSRRLGLTYHAGEDFHHPVEGLRDLSGLSRHLLRSGDRVGHALAPGLDVERFQSRRGAVPLPKGVLLDDLVWLRREFGRLGHWQGGWQAASERAVSSLAHEIYGLPVAANILEAALDRRFHLPRRAEPGDPPDVDLVWREATDAATIAQRAQTAAASPVTTLYEAAPAIAELQAGLMRSLMNAGVIVEANPSSNLVTGCVDTLRQHPFFRFEEVLGDDNIVTVNTDDPGVFGTRLDVEFALLFEAKLDNGFGRGRALQVMERIRRLGVDSAFAS